MPGFLMFRNRLARASAALAALSVVAVTACAPGRLAAPAFPPSSERASLPARSATTASETGAARTTSTAGATTFQAIQTPVARTPQDAVKDVVTRGNLAQVTAIASGDSSGMAATSTDRYYQELARINQQLLDNGVTSIKLVAMDWGDVTVSGNTATATTYETWRTVWSDGTTDDSRDRNDYRLVRDARAEGGWRIDADDHPGSGQRGQAAPAPQLPTEPRDPVPDVARDANSSTNWSGYAATGGTYTAVSGTWTVPQPDMYGTAGSSAAWVGIGGVRGRDLIQAGTQASVSGSGRATYHAWVETLPQAAKNVPLAVAPGDSITVSIDEQSTNFWQVTLTNNTTGQSYQQTIQYASSHSSVEWVQEAPSIGRRGIVALDDFGQVEFTGGAAIKNGQVTNISGSGARPVTMIDRSGTRVAVPSPLREDGSSFTVARVPSNA